jgi:light-regulated signal transduction histidine kinase (bacteriophytochrome)
MGQLIDDLLKLSRVTRSEMRHERMDMTALAEGVIAEMREHEPGRTVTFTARPGLTAEGDPPLIRVVLENFLGNAWKFTAKNPAPVIAFDRAEVAGRPGFVVRDDGAGFDMAFAGKLFRAFQRLHSDREFTGTGIGLATVQRVIRRHGGEVLAEGAVGRGAAFSFTLPGREHHT